MTTLTMSPFTPPMSLASDLSRVQRAALSVLVVALHGAAAWGIWNLADSVTLPAGAPPITVALISDEPTPPSAPPAPVVDVETPPQPKPAPVTPVRREPPPLAVAAKKPEEASVAAPVPAPVQPMDTQPTRQEAAPSAPPGPVNNAAAAQTGPSSQTPPAPPAPKVLPSSAVRYLVPPALAYPRISRELGESGVVRLKVLVDEQGRTKDVVVLQSSGYSRLDQQAVQAMRAARFQPHLEDGVPRAVWVVAPLTFQLEDQ